MEAQAGVQLSIFFAMLAIATEIVLQNVFMKKQVTSFQALIVYFPLWIIRLYQKLY